MQQHNLPANLTNNDPKTLAHRLGLSFGSLATTLTATNSPIMWMEEPTQQVETAQQLALMDMDILNTDLAKVKNMLTYGSATSDDEFAGTVNMLMSMPTRKEDEMMAHGYLQILRTSLGNVPLWAIRFAIDKLVAVETFRPQPCTITKFLPIEFKRARARAWELERAIAIKARQDAQDATDRQASDQEYQDRIDGLSTADRATFDAMKKNDDWQGMAKLLARKPAPQPKTKTPAKPKRASLSAHLAQIKQSFPALNGTPE